MSSDSGPQWRRAFCAVLVRDMRLRLRHGSDWGSPLVFFALITTLFPLATTPDPVTLARVAPGVVWVAALLAVLLSLEALFREDRDDGTLEQMMFSPVPTWWLVLAKLCAHWLMTGLPLALVAPVPGIMLALPAQGFWALSLSLALGSATLILIGAIGAALTVSVRRGGLLLSLMVLPLYIPVLIFGAGVVRLAGEGAAVAPYLAILGALLAGALALAPWACAAALRLGQDS
ncbi:heme exporter protein CcmB [Larsenimonas rhizosphaerae]|uniref:Heme exporter protein B n=1 Tax=Larsenimonas rhizosphaerae TaxID=2944682 RepID=A0AA41ZCE3_9GAMM|nr:heme exporter protein CcmB [Larsenimonas rhizosphaerae]MCM2130000.1 heme exporter protein CcmB [Larsenimonas rhizosphaerae]MCX2522699.1 heme exporter protein CcmB [Larsenimonas rhizosphaerae]